jgi:uncharacterized protein YutE (UPF0331/DUF86 family)
MSGRRLQEKSCETFVSGGSVKVVYDVNVGRIAGQLRYLERCAEVLESLESDVSAPVRRFAAERALHLAVECMIDVGSVMIDGFIMRDPGGYLDIVDILEDERVITAETAEGIRKQVRIRERLVRHYHEVEEEEIRPFLEGTELYRSFIRQVAAYIRQELGEELSL